MAAEDNGNGIFEEVQSNFNAKEWLSKYLTNWPLFLVSIAISVGAGFLYIRNTVPKYIANTIFLIKSAQVGGGSSGDLIESAINGKSEVNLNNEIRLLKANNLMERTVVKNDFNTSYFIKGRILNSEIYNVVPFTLIAKHLSDSNSTYDFFIEKIHVLGGYFLYGPENSRKTYSFRWNVPFTINGQVFVLASKRMIGNEDGAFIARWEPPYQTAAKLLDDLTVNPIDTKSSVIQLSLKTENLQKGQDVLNALFKEFNLADIEDRNKLFESTVAFIDERLVSISGELKGVEGNLENYQGKKQLIDIRGQTSQSLGNSDEVSKSIQTLAVEQGVTSMIQEYFTKPDNGSRLVPSSFGLNDGTLASLISQYNDLQLKKGREAPLVAPNSTVMQDLNTQLGNLKQSILENLSNIKKNLQLKENSFKSQNSQYKSFLSSIPHNERVLQEIRRKQNITEGLYLYLLQKREETAISSTGANLSHYQQIDPASGYGPVEPNTKNIILYSVLLGLFLAAGWIYLRDSLLNDKVASRDDVLKRVTRPLIGQISHIPKKKKQAIAVLGRTLAGEEFRAVRTKLYFLLKNKNKKVILVTSSLSNEGKSFSSLNLAAVCAIPGKKVALLEFDIRNPSIAITLQLNNTKGLTDFLSGDIKTLSEISYGVKDIPTLHIYPSGAVTLNPADLLLSENISRLFQILKEQYDYIIVDSPPVGLVSDAFILDPYCEMVLYIIRERTTLKSKLEIINDVKKSGHLNNIYLVLNDVEVRGNNEYYGYGYGYGYKNKKSPEKKLSLARFFNF